MQQDQKQIYLIRHGQTDHNGQRIFQDDMISLNDTGLTQANLAAKKLTSDIEVVISSPLNRAKETARIIAKKMNCQIEFNNLLVELKNPPEIRGKPYDDPYTSEIYEKWNSKLLHPASYGLNDTENYHDLIMRANQTLDMLSERQERSIAIITHSEFMRAILTCVLIGEATNPKLFNHVKSHLKLQNAATVILRITTTSHGVNYKIVL